MTYERITAADIRPGMRVARARTHPFHEVEEVHPGPRAVTLVYVTTFDPAYPPRPGQQHGGRQFDRPRLTASWWRELDAVEESHEKGRRGMMAAAGPPLEHLPTADDEGPMIDADTAAALAREEVPNTRTPEFLRDYRAARPDMSTAVPGGRLAGEDYGS